MSSYERLFKAGLEESDVREIKAKFSGDSGVTSWEDYYWASKCIIDYDMDDFEPKFMCMMLNNTLKYGLTYRGNKECYLDTIKMLASINALMGKYDLVLNYLNAVIELDSDAPDWVFHDLVSAQNRTRSIKKNLKSPAMFLSDLAHNDGNKPETKKKQENIFKEFLAAGIVFISENKDAIVDKKAIAGAAMDYGLLKSKEWKAFEAACGGKVSENTKIRVEQIEQEEKLLQHDVQKEEKAEDFKKTENVRSRPLVISLFPEDDEVDSKLSDMEKRYNELVERLSTTQTELDSKNKELEEAGFTLEQLTEANNNLETIVRKNLADMADFERELQEKTVNIESLEKRLKLAKKDSSESKELERQLSEAQAQKSEMFKQIEAVKQALSDSEQKLKNAGEQIAKIAVENKELKDKLENSEPHVFSSNKAAVIIGNCKTIEYIATEKLARWLNKNLNCFNNWWDRYVISVLKPEQVLKAQDGHYTTLQEFDLTALLRIFVKNWQKLCQYNFLTQSDKDTVVAMFDVRNNLAHSDVAPLNKESVIGDLAIISTFLGVINANSESKDVAKFAKEVALMELD